MFENIKSKIFNKEDVVVEELTTNEVVLEALCAYRDKLVLDSSDYTTHQIKLAHLRMAIDDIVKDMIGR